MSIEKLREFKRLLEAFEAAVVDRTEARRVTDAEEESERVETLRSSILLRIASQGGCD